MSYIFLHNCNTKNCTVSKCAFACNARISCSNTCAYVIFAHLLRKKMLYKTITPSQNLCFIPRTAWWLAAKPINSSQNLCYISEVAKIALYRKCDFCASIAQKSAIFHTKDSVFRILFPLHSCRRFVCNVVNDTVDTVDLVGYPS